MRRTLFFIILSRALSSCVHEPMIPRVTDNYPGNISVIMSVNCLGGNCHSGATDVNTKLDLSTWDAMTKGSVFFNEVVPFSAAKSHFFAHINTNKSRGPVVIPTMPLARDPLSETDQIAFLDWINDGAKSADGKIPYSDVSKKIFIVNQSEDMISVIDADTKRLVRVISSGAKYPTAITMMPDLKTFIVAIAGSNGLIKKFDASSYAALGEFQSDLNPSSIAVTSDGTKGYFTDELGNGNRFGVLNPVSMKLIKAVSSQLIEDPVDVAIAPDGKYAYICGHGSDNIIRIDTRNDSVVGCLPLGDDVAIPFIPTYISKYQPEKVVITSDSKIMYVTCIGSSEVIAFDLMQDTIVARIPIHYQPWGEALRPPNEAELWTATYGSNAIHVISTSENKVVFQIDSISQLPRAITFTPDGAFAYVACELSAGGAHHHGTGGVAPSSYVVIDCNTRKVVSIQDLPATSVSVTVGYK